LDYSIADTIGRNARRKKAYLKSKVDLKQKHIQKACLAHAYAMSVARPQNPQ